MQGLPQFDYVVFLSLCNLTIGYCLIKKCFDVTLILCPQQASQNDRFGKLHMVFTVKL